MELKNQDRTSYYHWVKDEMGGEFCIENDKFSEFIKAKKNEITVADVVTVVKERKKRDKRGHSHAKLQDGAASVSLQEFVHNHNQDQESVTYFNEGKRYKNSLSRPIISSPLIGLIILGGSLLIVTLIALTLSPCFF